jgi:hypothetical protein
MGNQQISLEERIGKIINFAVTFMGLEYKSIYFPIFSLIRKALDFDVNE